MVIHQYDVDVIYPLAKCVHCGHETSLDEWQLFRMPKDLARCTSPDAPRMTLRQWLRYLVFLEINTLEDAR